MNLNANPWIHRILADEAGLNRELERRRVAFERGAEIAAAVAAAMADMEAASQATPTPASRADAAPHAPAAATRRTGLRSRLRRAGVGRPQPGGAEAVA